MFPSLIIRKKIVYSHGFRLTNHKRKFDNFFIVVVLKASVRRNSEARQMSIAPSGPYNIRLFVYVHKFNVFLFFPPSFSRSMCLCLFVSPWRIKLLTPYSLAVYDVERRDKGMYQCLITSKDSSAQAVAELKLGGELKWVCWRVHKLVVCMQQFNTHNCYLRLL